MSDDSNKRTFYRIDDKALVKARILDEEMLAQLDKDFDGCRMRYSLTTHVSHQRAQREPVLRLVRKRNPDVARYLELLEAQIETLAVQLIKDPDFDEYSEPQAINISATGLRFSSRLPIEAGQKLEIGLMLFPNERVIMAIGEAIRVDPLSSGAGVSVSAHFTRLHDEDQEMLIRHVHELQRIQLQNERERQNP